MDDYRGVFDKIETATVGIFTFEYLLRFSTRGGTCFSRLKWVFTNFFSIVDLISILPFYVDLAIPGRQSYLATQWVRVARLLRLLPPLPYDVIWKKSSKLLLASGFAGFTVWVICAALYYWFETGNPDMIYCPDEEFKKNDACWNRFHSIPAAMYYSVLNFFGEFPLADQHSLGGRFVGGFIQVMGAAVMAIPAGALGNAFSEVVEKEMNEEETEAADDAEAQKEKPTPKAGVAAVRCLDGERQVKTYPVTDDFTIDLADAWFVVSVLLVAASSLHFILGTLRHLPSRLDELLLVLQVLDVVATATFSVEYVYRICTATGVGFSSPLRYIVSGFGVIDGLCAVVPAMSYAFPRPLFRAFATLRILKLERYIGAFSSFKQILWQNRAVLSVTGGAAAVLWVIFSTLMYYAEHHNPDPEMAAHYSSVSTSMWVTLLNLSGEAPLCEYTTAGKFISALMGLIGVGFVTIPMGVLGSGFQDLLEQEDEDDDAADTKEGPTGQETFPSFRQLVYKFLQGSAANQVEDLNPWEARAVHFERLIFFTIFVTVIAAIMETVEGFDPPGSFNRQALDAIEIVATLLFTLEYGLRYFCAPEAPEWAAQGYVSDRAARWSFATSASSIIDLLAIAPYYLALCGSSLADQYDGELRMLRIFRLLTLDKYIPSVSLIGRVFTKHAKDFQMAAYASASLWLIFSALMWLTERHDGTEVDDLSMSQRYGNMLTAMPYTLVHLTGDYPLIDYDFPAKCVLFLALLFAVGVVSVPTGLLASGFTQELKKYRAEMRKKRADAATKIERAILSYLRRRRLRKITEDTKAQSMSIKRLKDSVKKDHPGKIKLVDFLEKKDAGRTSLEEDHVAPHHSECPRRDWRKHDLGQGGNRARHFKWLRVGECPPVHLRVPGQCMVCECQCQVLFPA
ncbi:unnamed protein product [Durusdinium trenchii]|uniref:Ion transport domain-containing protein n=1 Tax=Durusdinium trenchii TaxID=1381693 RepID=A0ABP0NB95_9DINO